MPDADTAVASSLASAQKQDPPQSPKSRHSRPVYKSYRKKYYKMRHRFHGLMNQNHKRFEEEQKTRRLARRLQEQNDQILQLLYESNQHQRLPANLRYNTNAKSKTPSISDLPTLTDDSDAAETGELPSNPAKSLRLLESVPHSSLDDLYTDDLAAEEADQSVFDDYIGFLSPNHETDYLAAMDTWETRSRSSLHESIIQSGPWSNHDSAAAALKNPVSVYNWLKKNQPNVFLNDEDKPPAAAATPAAASREDRGGGRSAPTKVQPKRASVGTRQQNDAAMDEDDYNATAGNHENANVGSLRGKRKQVEDEAYRPKGGSSRKRKKLSAGQLAADGDANA